MIARAAGDWVASWADYGPVVRGLLLGLATFVQEDVPTVAAAVGAASGLLTWPSAFVGCFLGIWAGDLLLYGIARRWGRGLLRYRGIRRWVSSEAVVRSEAWFARRGDWLLVTSRFVPGLRLPTYLAAGFLRVPFVRFFGITGVLVFAWTAGIFAVAGWAGARFGEGSGAWRDRFGFGTVLIASGVLAIRFLPGWLARGVAALWRCAGGHWRRWEFWPAALFYLPVAANYVRLAVRYRGLTLPVAANPGMAFGGVVGESKYATLRELYERDPDATAESWLLSRGETEDRCAAFRRLVAEAGIEFPLILKPDLGQRGLGVRRIGGLAEGEAYLRRTSADVVVQRYDPGPFEAGVFYYRFPGEERGRLFAITEKIFPSVVGDGVRTLEELVRADARARWIADRYLRRLGPRVSEVPPPGRSVPLVATGNHAQGCIFRDGWRWWTPELEQRFDAISRRLPGFFVGRYDVRFGDEEEFRSGRGFRIVELNGASAEATSIYDERHSIRTAYATLFRQWDLVFAIGAANRARGIRSVDPATLWRAWRDSSRLFATYPSAD